MTSRVFPAVIAVFSVLLPSTILAQAVTGTPPPPAEHVEAPPHPESAPRTELSPQLEGPPRVEREEPQTALVLCYHIVESPQDPRMEISRETFQQQMRYLAATGYNVIPLRDLYDYVAGRKHSLPKNAIVITIDDGWRSTYTEVYPEMKRHHFPFTVFIYPRIIGQTSHAMTWKQVREMADAGVDIQSHSLSHPFLTHRRHASLDDKAYYDWLEKELANSKRILEQETGKSVEFLAYPYGDYDSTVVKTAARTGYAAGLTCDYGPVRRGSDPLRMRRFAIDKRMDFTSFRHFLGAGQMQLAHMTPPPGQALDTVTLAATAGTSAPAPPPMVISAKIPNYKRLDPKSVGMTLMSAAGITPFAYDPRDGSISLTIKDTLKGKFQRALVWATDVKTGKRLEAMWSFRLPEPPALVDPTVCPPTDGPATLPTQLATPTVASQPGGPAAAVPAGGPRAEGQVPRGQTRPH
jgi:peptidoglycan/xylan/chitin deacetylase (PgdA/CDA1 family)